MKTDEYLLDRIAQLEKENERLKSAKPEGWLRWSTALKNGLSNGWPMVLFTLLFLVVPVALLVVNVSSRAKNHVRNSVCTEWCTENRQSLTLDEYQNCFQKCEEWRCE